MIKTLIMLKKIYISDECCSSELSIKKKTEKTYSAVIIIIINIFLAANRHIRMLLYRILE